MDERELKSWLRFSRLELSPVQAKILLDRFGSPEAILDATESELQALGTITKNTVAKILARPARDVDDDLRLIEKLSVTLVPITSDSYPVNLRHIYDPPVLLYVRGSLCESDKMSIAIVGSRRAGTYGLSIAEKIAKDLATAGLTIISGGARGVDTAAHKGALEADGRTVAFLGCGVDICYPPENKKLFELITDAGALVSEFPFGSAPEAWRFPPRNRLISGMSLGVLVCQSPVASGALITAGYAAEQGKDVYAVPGNVDDDRNGGCHALIKDGAKCVESADDILAELGLQSEENRSPQMALPIESLTNDNERKIAELLSLEPIQVDDIIEKTGLPAPLVAGTLTILEMKNIARRVPGNAYVRVL